MANYPYAPPPPPPSSSAAPTGQYTSFNQPHSYNSGSHRGGQSSYAGGRGRGHHDFGQNSRYYAHPPDYMHPPSNGAYTTPQASAHWQSTPTITHYPNQPGAPHPPSTYPTNYTPQSYNATAGQGYPYPNARPAHGAHYPAYPNDSSLRWSDQGQTFSSHSGRGGRGGFQSDRGGHKSENPIVPPAPLRLGFDHNSDRVAHPSTPYGSSYPPGPQPRPFAQPPYSYPHPEAPYSAAAHAPHNTHGHAHRGGPGRDGFGHHGRGGRGGHNGRGEKFRHRDQRPPHGPNASQKPDAAVHAKKKKRKTNTLGLTPGDESSEGEDALEDEEKHLIELLGADVPVISDMSAWIAERKANFPTKARVEAKKAASAVSAPKTDDSSKSIITRVDREQAKIDKLEKKLSKLKGNLEKRKRAPNDEGDEMRADESQSGSNSSDDEEPEVQSTSKPQKSFLPPPPIIRADPSNHCKYYSTGGICGKKGKCRFKHDPAVREAAIQERARNGGQLTLKQRLLLNDKEHDDMIVVKTIVEMRSSGRLGDVPSVQPPTTTPAEEQVTASTSVPPTSTLPTTAGVASLPPNPYAASKKAWMQHK
ncbi:hypothetical protein GGR50DRAFT_108944 [Xylaria sp. CBS 124048]|nr:hypothetical protein GGR50DRAFT_108944 [Xylaria sp. CBS 124048]